MIHNTYTEISDIYYQYVMCGNALHLPLPIPLSTTHPHYKVVWTTMHNAVLIAVLTLKRCFRCYQWPNEVPHSKSCHTILRTVTNYILAVHLVHAHI